MYTIYNRVTRGVKVDFNSDAVVSRVDANKGFILTGG